MLDFNNIKAVYLVGAGGIGVSALGRYFAALGCFVSGYDKTPSRITDSLVSEGIAVHFEDDVNLIPAEIINCSTEELLVIYTPAVPKSHSELNYFQNNSFHVLKRAHVLGLISKNHNTIAVAGTHGKTSVSTMIAHVFNSADQAMNAVLGGISKNYDSNLILNKSHEGGFMITEADEFDRSFLHLNPNTLVLTSMDADHLDIYKDIHDLHQTFEALIDNIPDGGKLVIKKGLKVRKSKVNLTTFTYAYSSMADFYAKNIRLEGRTSVFDLQTPGETIANIRLQIPGRLNIENAVAAGAAGYLNGLSAEEIRAGLGTWLGVSRRFDYVYRNENVVYIDDYAHHPEELNAFIASVRDIHQGRILGVFQPHLYTRTRDFSAEFAKSLSQLDELLLLEIYPAREEAIAGINSKIILDAVTIECKAIVAKSDLQAVIAQKEYDVLLTMGAGDIDRFVKPLKMQLETQFGENQITL